MAEWMQVLLGIVVSLLIFVAIFKIATRPRKLGSKEWLAPWSENQHDNGDANNSGINF